VGVSLSDVDQPPKLLLLTSSVPGEGKSTLAASLAISSASGGARTLLIDCDLRHPSTTASFGLRGKAGLVELLGGSRELKDVIATFSNGSLSIIPAGGRTTNPSDLLGSQKMKRLLEVVRENFDLVICDTPPVTAVSDCTVVAKLVDKIVFVVEWKTTPRDVVVRGLGILEDDRHRFAGVVLNRVNTKEMRYYSSYYSYYSYKYQGYYDV
jgi:capsular exopolysaccharide synthesis family protein